MKIYPLMNSKIACIESSQPIVAMDSLRSATVQQKQFSVYGNIKKLVYGFQYRQLMQKGVQMTTYGPRERSRPAGNYQ